MDYVNTINCLTINWLFQKYDKLKLSNPLELLTYCRIINILVIQMRYCEYLQGIAEIIFSIQLFTGNILE